MIQKSKNQKVKKVKKEIPLLWKEGELDFENEFKFRREGYLFHDISELTDFSDEEDLDETF